LDLAISLVILKEDLRREKSAGGPFRYDYNIGADELCNGYSFDDLKPPAADALKYSEPVDGHVENSINIPCQI